MEPGKNLKAYIHHGLLLPNSITNRHVNTVKRSTYREHYYWSTTISKHDKNKTTTTKSFLDLRRQTGVERKEKS